MESPASSSGALAETHSQVTQLALLIVSHYSDCVCLGRCAHVTFDSEHTWARDDVSAALGFAQAVNLEVQHKTYMAMRPKGSLSPLEIGTPHLEMCRPILRRKAHLEMCLGHLETRSSQDAPPILRCVHLKMGDPILRRLHLKIGWWVILR